MNFVFLTAVIVVPALYAHITGPTGISHVQLVSIDGMQALTMLIAPMASPQSATGRRTARRWVPLD